MQPLIHIERATLRIGTATAFEDTTWRIDKGTHWALFGGTGSGKSLLVGALCRKVPLAAGGITYYFDAEPRPFVYPGEILTLSQESHQGFLRRYAEYHQARWQSFEGDEAPTVGELLTAQGSHQALSHTAGQPTRDEDGRALEAQRQALMALFALEPLWERRLIHLSHGESRKVFLARLLLQSPRLLILDNFYTGLDEASRRTLGGALEALLEVDQPQILFVSNRAAEIPAGVDHICEVQDLRLHYAGPRTGWSKPQPTPGEHGSAHLSPNPPDGHFDGMAAGYAAALTRRLETENGALIRMANVSVRYGDVTVLQGVNWEVRQGERWALLGSNGAGKSTLLSLVLGDNTQGYQNDLWLFGRRRGSGESIWDIKEKIGWVSPELHIYYPPQVSCAEVVCSGFFDSAGLYRACTVAQAACAAGWVRAFGLQRLADKRFRDLSAGQQRLALLGRALVKNPLLLILDEPCAALDAEYRRDFIAFLERLCARTPVSLIYITHDPQEIPPAMTHRLRLEGGRVMENEKINPHGIDEGAGSEKRPVPETPLYPDLFHKMEE